MTLYAMRWMVVATMAAALVSGCDDAGSAGSGSASAAVTPASAAATAAPTTAAASAEPEAAKLPDGSELFGAPLSEGDPLTLASVLEAPEKYAEGLHKVSGTVKTVCKKKGCWMTLVTGADEPHAPVRVTFKDYGFFVPKDCDGSMATIEGTIAVKEESEEVAKHYAEDEGRDPAEVKGPIKTIAIVASGAIIKRGEGDADADADGEG